MPKRFSAISSAWPARGSHGRRLPDGLGRAGRLARFRSIARRLRESWALRGLTANSLDAAGDRDFALDYLYALATLATHLSRLAEDFVLFASQEFGFIVLPDEYSTGSSLMPQKKNPDAWELLRGKTGRVTGVAAHAADDAQGPALELPARFAGGQGAGVRRARSGAWRW